MPKRRRSLREAARLHAPLLLQKRAPLSTNEKNGDSRDDKSSQFRQCSFANSRRQHAALHLCRRQTSARASVRFDDDKMRACCRRRCSLVALVGRRRRHRRHRRRRRPCCHLKFGIEFGASARHLTPGRRPPSACRPPGRRQPVARAVAGCRVQLAPTDADHRRRRRRRCRPAGAQFFMRALARHSAAAGEQGARARRVMCKVDQRARQNSSAARSSAVAAAVSCVRLIDASRQRIQMRARVRMVWERERVFPLVAR